MESSGSRHRRFAVLAALLLVALGLRVGYVLAQPDLLAADVDDYGKTARLLAEHGVYTVDEETLAPMAYRPVLYPLLLAGLRLVFGDALWPVAAMQIVMALATVVVVWCVGERLAGPVGGAVAGGVAAVDPLLVHASALRMTEATSALLTALAVWAVVRIGPERTGRAALLAGALLGLGALCRPIVWGWAVLLLVVLKFRKDLSPRARLAGLSLLLVGLVGVQLPWIVRNWVRLGVPVWTTTHGGYTLHLGNNASFYETVVADPDNDVWPAEAQHAWIANFEAEAKKEQLTERQKDAEHYRRAWRFARERPDAFLQCSWLKLCRFWGVRPHEVYSPAARWAAAVWYVPQLALLVVGLIVGRGWRWPLIALAAALVVFSGTHAVFWSNMRMRAPLVPIVAVFVGVAVAWLVERFSRPEGRG